MFRQFFFAVTSVFMAAACPLPAQVVTPYQVTIDYEIFETGNPDTYFQLVGQSAYLQFRTDGLTSGGQLDFATGPGSGSVVYNEVFPPPALSDFLEFAYFGLVETRSSLDDSVIDTSFVMALKPLGNASITFQDFFPSYTENDIVNALGSSFDSPEFFAMFGEVPALSGGVGTIGLPELGIPGDTMELVAFLGGVNGDERVGIGTIATTVVIPEPAAPLLFGLACIGLLRRQRESVA